MDFGSVGIALLALFFLWLGKLIWNVIDHRRLVRNFPGPNGHSMIWGHAKILAEVASEPDHTERRCQRVTDTGTIPYTQRILNANEVR